MSLQDDLHRGRAERKPVMALRPDHRFPDELDDIVVKDVSMFRMEAMDDHCFWMACYFANGDSIGFAVCRERKPARTVVKVTEECFADGWVDLDAKAGES